MVVSHAGLFVVKAMLPEHSCEFTAISYCLGFCGLWVFGFSFFFFLKTNIILLIKVLVTRARVACVVL